MKMRSAILGLLLLASSSLMADVTFVSTLGSGAISNYIGCGTTFATRFATGSTCDYTYAISSVSMYISAPSGSSVTYTLGIYSDSSGSVGSLLYSATDVSVTGTGVAELVTFGFTGTSTLEANTSYWLKLTSTNSSIQYTTGASVSGSYGWSLGSTNLYFSGWTYTGAATPQFGISGTVAAAAANPGVSSVSSVTATEGSPLSHTVTLSAPTGVAADYALALAGDSAMIGSDTGTVAVNYADGNGDQTVTLTSGSATITAPANVSSFTVKVATVADSVYEGSETYTLTVGGVSGTGTISDDDSVPTVSSVTDEEGTEGDTISQTVTLSNPSSTTTDFTLSLAGGSATIGTDTGDITVNYGGSDIAVTLTSGSATITVPANVSSFTVKVATIDDSVYEGSETYTLTVGGESGTGTINDDDSAPTVGTVSDGEATEGSTISQTVALSNTSSTATYFTLSLAGGSATIGTDTGDIAVNYGGSDVAVTLTSGSATITVPANVSSFTVRVATVADSVYEGSETYTLTVGGVSGTGTINDDDSVPTVGSVTDEEATEGGAIAQTVTLSNPSSTATDFTLSLAGGSATIGADTGTVTVNYADGNGDQIVTLTSGSATITVPANISSFTVKVATIDDSVYEGSETYTLTVGGVSGMGTINDDDSAPTVSSVGNASNTEGGGIVHTVAMSNPSASFATYALTLAGVSATVGTDTGAVTALTFNNSVTYDSGTGLINVPAGVTSFTVTVPTYTDAISEGSETYTLTIGSAFGTGTITDDAIAPTVPTNLAGSATSTTAITLTWTASTDEIGVTGYRIYRGGTAIGTSTTTSYADSGLTAGTAYAYTVTAYDAAGNESAASASVTVSTQLDGAQTLEVSDSAGLLAALNTAAANPSATFTITLAAGTYTPTAGLTLSTDGLTLEGSGTISGSGLTSGDLLTISGDNVTLSGLTFADGTITITSGADTGTVVDCTFNAVSIAGTGCTGWTITGGAFNDATTAALTFTAAADLTLTDNVVVDCARALVLSDLSGPTVRNNFIANNSTTNALASIVLTDVTTAQIDNNSIYQSGTAADAIEYAGNSAVGAIRNNLANKLVTATGTATATLATNYTAAAASWFSDVTTGDLHLAAKQSAVVDAGTTLAGLNVDIDGDARPTGSAYDIGADECQPDTVAPTAPTGLSATVNSATTITLIWTASSDSAPSGVIVTGVAGYRIYRNGTAIGTSTTTSYADATLSAGTTYSYTVTAYDGEANESAASSSVSATTAKADSSGGGGACGLLLPVAFALLALGRRRLMRR